MERLWFAGGLMAFAGCGLMTGDVPSGPLGPSTGAPSTGAGGDPIAVDNPCCVDLPEPPFQGPSWFTFGAPGPAPACPDASTEGLTGYHEMKVEPHTCGACDCSPAACTLPGGVHTNAAKCPGDGSFAVPFGPDPAAWTGACSDEGALPAGLQCNGALCVESVTIPALEVAPCAAVAAPADPPPDPTWGRMARQCVIDLPSSTACDEEQACLPAMPSGLSLCLHAPGDHPVCPAAYPDRAVFYRSVTDERGCEACACSAPSGAQCLAIFEMFVDASCNAPAGTVVVTDQLAACVDVVTGTALGSAEATMVTDLAGSCAPSGGAPFGAVLPADPFTLCCQANPEPPG